MKFPETADDIVREIFISCDKSKKLGELRLRQLIELLPKVNAEIIVEAVIRIFETGTSVGGNYRVQEFAGRILKDIKPESKKDLKEILHRTLKNWDKSVEQFPFWLRDNYGLIKLKETFAALELSACEADKLKTIQWWLQIN